MNTFNPTLIHQQQNIGNDSNRIVSSTQWLNVQYQENNYQPLLTQMQQHEDNRWILFVAPPGKPSKQFLLQAGIDSARVLIIDSTKVNDKLSLLCTLLQSKNFATIVTWLPFLSPITEAQIKKEAALSHTHCHIYCQH